MCVVTAAAAAAAAAHVAGLVSAPATIIPLPSC